MLGPFLPALDAGEWASVTLRFYFGCTKTWTKKFGGGDDRSATQNDGSFTALGVRGPLLVRFFASTAEEARHAADRHVEGRAAQAD
jgi:hypothetical protein